MELTRRASSRTDRAEDARRSRLILLLAEGHTWDEASERIDCSRGFVASWSKRFAEQRIAGLYSRHIGQVASVLTPELEARILEATRHPPSDSTHWKTLSLGTNPDVPTAQAQSRHSAARQLLAAGVDPSLRRRELRQIEACGFGKAFELPLKWQQTG